MSWILFPIIFIVIAMLLFYIGELIVMPSFLQFIVNACCVTAGIIACISLLFSPVSYYSGLNKSVAWTAYYENIIKPNIIEEHDDYVIVKNNNAALWQAGNSNLAEYLRYYSTTKYWETVPFISLTVYPVPSNLKLVKVNGE
jgi:hypothetical protein